MKQKPKTFREFFEAQFGKRPNLPEGDDELSGLVARGRSAEDQLNKCIEWDAKRDAALKGWCARDK